MKLNKLLEDIRQINLLSENKGQFAAVLRDLLQLGSGWVLGGGLAVGFYAPPRGTQDIDVFLGDEQQLQQLRDNITGAFRTVRPHALEHKLTGIEVETLTPEFLRIEPRIIQKIIETAETKDGIKVVSREGLVVLKLMRTSNRDKGDIESIIQTGGSVSLDGYDLTIEQLQVYQELEKIALNKKPLE